MRNPTVKRRDRWAPDILATDVLADHSPPAAFISHHATNPDQREHKGFGVTQGFGVTHAHTPISEAIPGKLQKRVEIAHVFASLEMVPPVRPPSILIRK